VPISTARRANAPIIERLSYGAMGGCFSRLYLSQDRQNIGREGVRSLPVCGHALCLRIPQISAVSMTPVPESKMASCVSQGKYIDTLTHECTATRTAPPPVLSAQQQARQDRFEAEVQPTAAKCTTGTKENCLLYARLQELRTQASCDGSYGPGVYNIWGYKRIGWPAEMTAEHIGLPPELIAPLLRAGYTKDWVSASEFSQEAQRRCLNGDLF
jgi:hypothetical protein